MTSTTVQIRSKGVLTLPVELRRRYGFNAGDAFTLIDLGDGAFLLTPRASSVARLGNQVARTLDSEGVSLGEMLKTLDEEREQYYQEHYIQA